MYHQDWLMRQIEIITRYVFSLLLGKGEELSSDIRLETTRPTNAGTSPLELQLSDLVGEGRIGEAENLLFAAVEDEHPEALFIGLRFYRNLNDLPEETLEEYGFPREEVLSGLKDLCAAYGYELSMLGL